MTEPKPKRVPRRTKANSSAATKTPAPAETGFPIVPPPETFDIEAIRNALVPVMEASLKKALDQARLADRPFLELQGQIARTTVEIELDILQGINGGLNRIHAMSAGVAAIAGLMNRLGHRFGPVVMATFEDMNTRFNAENKGGTS